MLKKPKLPPAKFAEWASTLLHLETLAEAACVVQLGGFDQKQLLRTLVREARRLRQDFVRQMEKAK